VIVAHLLSEMPSNLITESKSYPCQTHARYLGGRVGKLKPCM